MAKDRFDDEYDIDDGSGRRTKHVAGGRTAYNVPPNVTFFKPKKSGAHNLDVVPFRVTDQMNRFHRDLQFTEPGKWYPERTFWVHYAVGLNEDTYCCLAKTFNKPCPICEEATRFRNSPHPEDKKKAGNLIPKERQLFLIYDTEAPDKGLQLWEVSFHLFFKQLDIWITGVPEKSRPKYAAYYHPITGMTIRITCTEKSAGPNSKPFTEFATHSMTDRPEPLPEAIRKHGIDLDALPIQMPYDKLKAIFEGHLDGDDDDDNGGDGDQQESPPETRPTRTQTTQNGSEHKSAPAPRSAKPEPAPLKFATKDTVSFEFRGDMIKGTIASVDQDGRIARVMVEGREKPITLDFDELTLVQSDDTFDLKDPPADAKPQAPQGTKGKPSAWDDDDNAPFPAPQGGAKGGKGKRQ